MKAIRGLGLLLLFGMCCSQFSMAQEVIWALQRGLTSPLRGQYGREAILTDSLLFELLSGSFIKPTDSDELQRPGKWSAIEVNSEGWMQHRNLRGGYLFTTLSSRKSEILVLEASGHQEVYVNGIPRGGDVYGYDWILDPVKVTRGDNYLMFHVARGRVKARLIKPNFPVYLTEKDILLPDIIENQTDVTFGSVRLVNATEEDLVGWALRISAPDGSVQESKVPRITRLSVRKVRFDLPVTFLK